MKSRVTTLIAVMILLSACQSNGQVERASNENVVVFNHEDVLGVFNEMKPNRSHVANIASKTEPGERLRITGIVYESDGKTPAKNVQMYFYHTDAKGIYAKRGTEPRNSFAWWHGYNRGALTTNDKGAYEINTIKPAHYPARVEPAHIHVIVKSPTQKAAYDIGAITFKGDVLATETYWYQVEQNGHPRDGGVVLTKNAQGILEGKMNYVLYAQFDSASTNSGLLPGEECPAFSPQHAFGQDKGSSACPMCKYGYKQGVMAWVNTDDWAGIAKLGQFLEARISEKGLKNMRAFIIYMNPKRLPPAEVNSTLNASAKEAGLKDVALLYIPSPDDPNTSRLYRLNPNKEVRNTVFVYKRRRVADTFVNMDYNTESLAVLMRSLNQAMLK